VAEISTCPGPDECFDDLCRGQDFGLCGKASSRISDDPWGEEYDDGPEPCPMGCGRTTDDVTGGPCSTCWQEAPRA
jgi:hypothetical protein